MKKFITSDIHFNHKNILKYCGNPRVDFSFNKTIVDLDGEFVISPEEVDALVESMNEKIITNWNSKVDPDDEVTIVGDVAMGQIKFAPDLIRRLNGKKFLVEGNHDKTLVKLIKNNEEFSDLFARIDKYFEMSHAVDGKKHLLCIMHFPLLHFNGQNQGTIHLHGHLHSKAEDRFRLGKRMMDIGMDGNNLTPYLLDDVVRQCLEFPFGGSHHD